MTSRKETSNITLASPGDGPKKNTKKGSGEKTFATIGQHNDAQWYMAQRTFRDPQRGKGGGGR